MSRKIAMLMLSLMLVSTAQAVFKRELTMLIVPHDAKAVRIAQDIAASYPVLLVVYRQTGGSLRLHAWNGENWVAVPAADYATGSFFTNALQHAVLILPAAMPVPDKLVPAAPWFPGGHRLLSTDPRVLIHLLGRHFNFSYRQWKEFAGRYRYELEQVNPGLVNVYWWHYRGDAAFGKLSQRNPEADLHLWQALDIPLAEPAADEPPAVNVPAPAPEPAPLLQAEPAPVETPAVQADPFASGDMPSAEIITPASP